MCLHYYTRETEKLLRHKVKKGSTLMLTAEPAQHTFGYPLMPENTEASSDRAPILLK